MDGLERSLRQTISDFRAANVELSDKLSEEQKRSCQWKSEAAEAHALNAELHGDISSMEADAKQRRNPICGCSIEVGECNGAWWFLLHSSIGKFDKENGSAYATKSGARRAAMDTAKRLRWGVENEFECGDEESRPMVAKEK